MGIEREGREDGTTHVWHRTQMTGVKGLNQPSSHSEAYLLLLL